MVAEFKLLDNFFDLMMDNPTPQRVIEFKASPEEELWIEALIAKSKQGRLSVEEQADIDYFLKVERAVALAKAKALVKLQAARG